MDVRGVYHLLVCWIILITLESGIFKLMFTPVVPNIQLLENPIPPCCPVLRAPAESQKPSLEISALEAGRLIEYQKGP